jgi:hypothetical protein
LSDDIALVIEGDIDGLSVFHGCTAPDGLTVLLEPGYVGIAARFDAIACLSLAPGTGAAEVFDSALPVATAGGVVDELVVAFCARAAPRVKLQSATATAKARVMGVFPQFNEIGDLGPGN